MIWLKIKALWSSLVGKYTRPVMKPDVRAQLSPEQLDEIAQLADALGKQNVSVRDVAKNEAIPDEPEIDDKPLS